MTLRLTSVIVLAIAAAALIPSLRYPAFVLAGRGSGCSLSRAALILEHDVELTRAKDRILASSKLVRTEGSLELYSTPYGEFWAPKGSRFILPFNLAEQEVKIYGTGPRDVQKGDVVLDCGANVGTFARFALDAGARIVVAVEPAPDNVECLRRNFPAEISQNRLIVYPKGVWDKDDTLELLVDPENQPADSFVIHRKGAKVGAKVPLTTIDRLVEELQLDRVDYIKMDIEGAEVRALYGARNTIERFRPRMSLSVYHQEDHPVSVPHAARAAFPGYRTECGPCAYANWAVRPDVIYFF